MTTTTTLQRLSTVSPASARVQHLASWVPTLWIAYIFIWYLQYKFTGHPGSVDLFTTLTDWLGFHGYEKVMRIGTGSTELVASLVLLVPRLRIYGAVMAIGIMTGAIFFHLASPLGVDPYGDGGVLFKEAVSVWLSGWLILILHRDEVAQLLLRFTAARAATRS
ncbi:MAG TPA: hypothetical protein VM689_19960 [Aliidongia sp.]|nr:hypothetical protein [Aliidongia sp.]